MPRTAQDQEGWSRERGRCILHFIGILYTIFNMPSPREGQRSFLVSDAAVIRLLGSPQRQAMVDTIVARGPTTVAELSGCYGRRPTASTIT